ncbi:MAG TPA: hypothetical protein VG013_18635 [Gemmataceae bacterium]|jgi:hypothetical protein|nr:hypothetical protein [Gemmataceae bacterium]
MATTTSNFPGCKAPCGRIVDGEHYQEQDEGCQVADNWYYACGCRSIAHEYADGSVQRKVIHHNGTVLEDDLVAEDHW